MSVSRSGSDDPRPVLVVITGHLTPYRVHLHRRIATELREVRLVTLVTKFRTGPWVNPNLPEIGCVMLDPREPSGSDRRGAGLFVHELATARRTSRWLGAHRPAAVICSGYDELPNLRALLWASWRGVPVFNWSDSSARSDRATGLRRIVKNQIVPRVVSRCTGLLVFGSEGRRFFERYGASAQRVWYAPLEPDYDQIREMPEATASRIAAELGLAGGRRRLVCCCRLIPTKRVDLVLDAFAAVAAERPEWDLLIAGDGPLRKELESRVPELRARSRVRFLGFLDQERVTAVYRSSDALVLASEIEPWALVVNEAAAAGLAVVTSDIVGAAPELVREGVNGYTFLSGDLADLTVRLRAVTDSVAIDRLKAGSPKVVDEWRRIADPVKGIRAALRSCGVIGS